MLRKVIFATAALVLLGGAAQAQKIGTYSGTADDGTFISISVDKGGTGGSFRFVNGNVNMAAKCTHPNRTANEGWGFFLGQDIVNGVNPFHSGNDYYDTDGTMKFAGPNTIKGTLTSVTAVFVPPSSPPPTKAQFCKSQKQAFTLSFQTAKGRNQHPTAMVLEKRVGH